MLFHYQKSIHTRKLSPGPFVNYKTYKKYLRIEFDATCIYCRMPDSLSEEKSYAVEHYRPKKKFPHLKNEYTNLYYSCSDCNSHKGEFWPCSNEISAGLIIPNPCEYVMHDHLRAGKDGEVNANSVTGKWAIDCLDLNEPGRVEKRSAILKLKKGLENHINQLKGTLKKLVEREKTSDASYSARLQIDIKEAEDKLVDLEKAIKIFGD